MAQAQARYRSGGTDTSTDARAIWTTIGGVAGAVLASSCCIVPLALVLLGVSGAWIGALTALSPYQPWFAGFAIVFLAHGFYRAYGLSRRACVDGACAARPVAPRITRFVLWVASVLVVLSMTIEWWAPLFY